MFVRSLLSTLLSLSVIAGCGGSGVADSAGARCDQFGATPAIDQSRTIEVGTELQVALCSNPTTGFAWGDPEIGDVSVLQLVDRTFRAQDKSSLAVVGAPGTEILTLRAVSPGTTTLLIAYGRSWEAGTPAEWTYSLTVTVP